MEEYNIIEKSMTLFEEAFDQYQKGETEEFEAVFKDFNKSELNVYVNSIAYKIGDWPECKQEYIVVNIRMLYKNNPVGYYDVCFDIDGQYEDDYFVIY